MQTIYERMGGAYRQEGDYLLPNIEAPKSPQISIWGQRRLQYLRTNKRTLYQAYAESHESDPPEIKDSFKELDELLGALPLDDNNSVFNLCCSLCTAYEHKAFIAGLQYGAYLIKELATE